MSHRQDDPGPPGSPETAREQSLRRQAERQLQRSEGPGARFPEAPSLENRTRNGQDLSQQHELQVHQIELALQMDELQRSNAELERMHDIYLDLYDLAPIGYFTLSEDGRILEVNRAGCQLLGRTRGQLLRHRFSAFVEEEDSVPFVQLLRRAFAGGQPCRLELGVVQAEGEKLHVQLDVRASVEGEQPYLRAAVTDVTALKAAQAALADLNSTLEERIQARTAQIRELNEELETFVQTVTHNLQTPLRQFTSFAELLRRKGPVRDGQAQHYYDAMLGSVERMERMVSALADYFQTGRQRPEMLSVDLERVLSDVRKELRPRLDGGTVAWQQDRLPTVTGDPRTLKQIFAALLDNALKFSAGRPRSEIHIMVREYEREYHIGVRDNGVGFNPRQQDRLFGIFQRLHSEREFSGLGTSLASVRRAVLRHGGRVWAECNEGPGSSFWLALPRNVPARR